MVHESPIEVLHDQQIFAPQVARRYVAVADVLGFAELVRNVGLSDLVTKYDAMIQGAANTFRQFANAKVEWVRANERLQPLFGDPKSTSGYTVFSDTILFWSECITDQDIVDDIGTEFLNLVSMVFRTALLNGLPLRVGIAVGHCVISPERNIYVGAPIVEAYMAEQSQDWVGIGCHRSCWEARKDIYQCPDLFLVRYSVPMKPGAAAEPIHWSTNWPYWQIDDAEQCLAAGVAKHVGTPYADRWHRAQEYYRHVNTWPPTAHA